MALVLFFSDSDTYEGIDDDGPEVVELTDEGVEENDSGNTLRHWNEEELKRIVFQ